MLRITFFSCLLAGLIGGVGEFAPAEEPVVPTANPIANPAAAPTAKPVAAAASSTHSSENPQLPSPASSGDQQKEGAGHSVIVVGPDGNHRVLQVTPQSESSAAHDVVDAVPLAERYLIGVQVKTIPDAVRESLRLPEEAHLVVAKVFPGKPAAKGGMQNGDILLSINDHLLNEPADIVRIVNEEKDAALTLKILREKEQQTLTVTPEKWSEDWAPIFGAHDARLPPDQALEYLKQMGLPPGTRIVGPGILVDPNTADQIELQARVDRLEHEVQVLQSQNARLLEIVEKLVGPQPPAAPTATDK